MSTTFPGIPDDERSFKSKYLVYEILKHVGVRDETHKVEVKDEVFVIKFKSPHARPAILAYADSCEKDDPKLAADLRRKLNTRHVDQVKKRLMTQRKEDHPMMQREQIPRRRPK